MKVVAICGSPRAGGNTEFFLRLMLEEMGKQGVEGELVFLADKDIRPCRGCYGCLTAKKCVQTDDFEEVFAKLLAADGIIIGTPVYVSKPTALLTAFLERVTFAGRGSGRLLSGKVGAPVAVARRAGHNFAFAELLLWYFINDMVIPGSMYWNVGLAGAKGAKDAAGDGEGIEIMKYAANNIVRVMAAMGQAGAAGPIDRDKLFYTAPKA